MQPGREGRLRSPVFVSLKRLADVARPMEARSEWYKPGTTNLINNLADGFKQIRRGAGLVEPNAGTVHCLRDTYTYRLKKMGWDSGTAAKLSGDTGETVMRFYNEVTEEDKLLWQSCLRRRTGANGCQMQSDRPASGRRHMDSALEKLICPSLAMDIGWSIVPNAHAGRGRLESGLLTTDPPYKGFRFSRLTPGAVGPYFSAVCGSDRRCGATSTNPSAIA